MNLNIRKGARRLAVVALGAWWARCLYELLDGCWLVGGRDTFTSFGTCTPMDGRAGAFSGGSSAVAGDFSLVAVRDREMGREGLPCGIGQNN